MVSFLSDVQFVQRLAIFGETREAKKIAFSGNV